MRTAALLALVALSACAPRTGVTGVSPNGSDRPGFVPGVPVESAEATAVLNGTLTYRERMALPAGAVVRVRIEDVSLADAPAGVVAEETFEPIREVPLPFSIPYNPARINVDRVYAVRGEIRDADGRLWWTTATQTPVFTRGAPIDGVEVVLEKVAD